MAAPDVSIPENNMAAQDPNVWSDPPANFDWNTANNIIQWDIQQGAPERIARDLQAQLGWSPTGLNGDWQTASNIIQFMTAAGQPEGITQQLQSQLGAGSAGGGAPPTAGPGTGGQGPANYDWQRAEDIIRFDLASGNSEGISQDLQAQLGWAPDNFTGDWGQAADIIHFDIASGAPGNSFHDLQAQLQWKDIFGGTPGPGGTPGTPGPGLTDIQKSARATMNATLGDFGLQSLGDFAWQEYLNGVPVEQVMLDIRQTPEYAARFPGMKALSDKGHAMSEGQYIAYEKQVTNIMRAAGFPEGMYDQPDDFKGFLENELSAQEVGQRVQDWLNFASTAPTANQEELQRLYGITPSGIAAFFTDPDRALPLLEKEANSALIGVQSMQGGYNQLSKQQAEYVAGLGIQPQQTLKGFQQLVQEQQLFNPLPGQAGPSFDQDQQLQAIFGGNQNSVTQLENVARQRVATNEGSYQYLADQRTSGVGGAEQT